LNKFFIFLVNIALGVSLAIQAIMHPTFDSAAKTRYLIAAVVFINWAVFTWLAYSSAMKEKQLGSASKSSAESPKNNIDHQLKSVLDVTTIAYLVAILLALIGLNVMVLQEVTEASYMIWIIVGAVLLPLAVTWIANRKVNKAKENSN